MSGRGWKGALLEKDWSTWKPVTGPKRIAFWTAITIISLPLRIPYEILRLPQRPKTLNPNIYLYK
jgi:hypothetical protein